MSIKLLNIAWDTPCRTGSQKLVLLALADNANDQHVCWPSVSTIGRRSGLTDTSVRTQIKDLEKQGLLTVVRQPGGRSSNVYTVLPGALASVQDRATTLRAPRNDVEGTPLNLNPQTPNPLPSDPNDVDPNHNTTTKKPLKTIAEPSPASPVKEFIDGWYKAFEEVFGERYVVEGAKDATAAKRLLASTGQTPAELIEVARLAWKNRANPKCFRCKLASSIASFVSQFNAIRIELGDIKVIQSKTETTKSNEFDAIISNKS